MTKVNPFTKYLGPEDHLQHQLITWLGFQYPDLWFHHSPNEGRRTPFEQFKFKYLGSDSGFPDLIFPSIYLVIELKIKPNKPTDAQNEWLEYFRKQRWRAEVVFDFETGKRIITERYDSLLIKQQESLAAGKDRHFKNTNYATN